MNGRCLLVRDPCRRDEEDNKDGGKEGTYQDIVSAPDVWNQIMVELGLSLNVLSFKPA